MNTDFNEKRPHVAMYVRLGRKEERKRVAIYARVASEERAGVDPLRMQIDSLKGIIHNQSEWECVGVYADNGKSGISANRSEFQRLLADCRARKIDLILAKSVSCFSRDAVQLAATIQQLRRMGVDVFFEKEGVYASRYPWFTHKTIL